MYGCPRLCKRSFARRRRVIGCYHISGICRLDLWLSTGRIPGGRVKAGHRCRVACSHRDMVCFSPQVIVNAEQVDELVARFKTSLDNLLALTKATA